MAPKIPAVNLNWSACALETKLLRVVLLIMCVYMNIYIFCLSLLFMQKTTIVSQEEGQLIYTVLETLNRQAHKKITLRQDQVLQEGLPNY